MEINEVRLANVERLARDYRYAKDFCAAAGIDPSYLSQLRSRTKALGTELTRRMEQRLGLDRGALDELPEPMRTPGHAATAIAHAIESLSPEVRQSIAALVFELAKQQMQLATMPAAVSSAPAAAVPVQSSGITVPDAGSTQGNSVSRRTPKR